MRHAHHGGLLNGGVTQERAFDLDGGDVLAAADDDVLPSVTNLDVAVRMHHGSIAAVEPTVANRLRCGDWIIVVACHDGVPANDDLTHGLAVLGNFVAGVVDHAHFGVGEVFDALPRFDH